MSKVQGTITTDNGVVGPLAINESSYGYVFVGNKDSSEFGGGSVEIQILNEGFASTVLKTITDLADSEQVATRFILPPRAEIQAQVVGSSSPDIFVSIHTGIREG